MYERTYWEDHVEDQSGQVIQQGTLQDQAHFNNMETGIDDEAFSRQIMMFQQRQAEYENRSEVHVLDLAMNSYEWPFNNKETTVALSILRENTNYSVDIDVIEYSGGLLGCIKVKERALNGFKLVHDGSATHVRIRVKVTGGMLEPMVSKNH